MAAPSIPLITGPQDPSQLNSTINALIESINGFTSGTAGSFITTPVSAASTAASIAATAGQVTVNSTTRTAGTTGRYTLAAPQIGVTLKVTSLSTVKSTLTGLFERGKTKISMTSTAAIGLTNLPSVILTGLSTAAWGVTAGIGKVLST